MISLRRDANTLCNSIDKQIMLLSEDTSGQPCIISDTSDDPYTQMYRLNEAFKHVAEARTLLRNCNNIKETK